MLHLRLSTVYAWCTKSCYMGSWHAPVLRRAGHPAHQAREAQDNARGLRQTALPKADRHTAA